MLLLCSLKKKLFRKSILKIVHNNKALCKLHNTLQNILITKTHEHSDIIIVVYNLVLLRNNHAAFGPYLNVFCM